MNFTANKQVSLFDQKVTNNVSPKTDADPMTNILKQIFSDSSGTLSSFRIMAFIALIGALTILCFDILLVNSERSYELVYVTIFTGIFGGKAFQKKHKNS